MTERYEWHVCIYPAHESALIIHETYGTREEAISRLKAADTAMRRNGVLESFIPELDNVTIVSGSMIVGAMIYRKKVEE